MSGRHPLAGAIESTGLPRSNGELVFEEPWQSRAFGMAVALSDAGVYHWEDFRQRLIGEIAARSHDAYYESWLAALETLLCDRGLLSDEEIARRAEEVAAHDDHAHDHHDHHHHEH